MALTEKLSDRFYRRLDELIEHLQRRVDRLPRRAGKDAIRMKARQVGRRRTVRAGG